jgi:hypothetical protein
MFTMKLKLNKPLNSIVAKKEKKGVYDPEFDDGRTVIHDICEIFEDTKAMTFDVSGFGDDKWYSGNCYFDLHVIVEQLPDIMFKMNNNDYNFSLDFYEQSMQRYLKFEDCGNYLKIVCNTTIYSKKWKPNPNEIEMLKSDIKDMFNELYNDFLLYANHLCQELSDEPLFIVNCKFNCPI